MLQLNQSDSQVTNTQQTPIKHPKMTRKLLTKETIQRSGNNDARASDTPQPFSDSIPAAAPAVPLYREPSNGEGNLVRAEQPGLMGRVQLQRQPDDASLMFSQFQQFQQQQLQQQQQQLQLQQQQQAYRYPPPERRRPISNYEVDAVVPEDYETFLSLEAQKQNPLVMQPRYRDVRSQSSELGKILFLIKVCKG